MAEDAVALKSKNIALNSRQKSKESTLFSAKVFWIGIGVTLALVFVHIIFQYLNLLVFGEKHGLIFELSNRFDFDDESSLPTWVSQAVFLVMGLCSFAASYLEHNKVKSKVWLIFGVIAVLISLDEVLSMHETLLQYLHVVYFGDSGSDAYANAWWFVLPIILVAAGWFLVKVFQNLPKRTVSLFFVGVSVYIIGAVAVDMVINAGPKTSFMSQGIMVAIEESLELVGGIICLYAIIEYIETRFAERVSKALKALKA